MFSTPDSWVWDFWIADDGDRYHLFFLYASKALHDPDDRHYRASIGHAVSTDLVEWKRVADALVRSDPPAFDDQATWTGSVVRHPDGTWYMFYTGATLTETGNIQAIGYATSKDLFTWHKAPGPVVAADDRWYELLSDGQWHDEAFRDPWVFQGEDDVWHMLITARARHGERYSRGVVGHAVSQDLRSWEVREPLSEPSLFGQLEVIQTAVVDDHPVILFSCLAAETVPELRATGTTGGVWVANAESLTGPFDINGATLLLDRRHYVGRFVQNRQGRTVLLAFCHDGPDGHFVGGISDPMSVEWRDGVLRVI